MGCWFKQSFDVWGIFVWNNSFFTITVNNVLVTHRNTSYNKTLFSHFFNKKRIFFDFFCNLILQGFRTACFITCLYSVVLTGLFWVKNWKLISTDCQLLTANCWQLIANFPFSPFNFQLKKDASTTYCLFFCVMWYVSILLDAMNHVPTMLTADCWQLTANS